MKRILITGVSGLVGDGISRYFLDNNWKVFGTSRNNIKSLNPLFTPIKIDINSQNNISALNKYLPFDAIVHCAARLPHSIQKESEINKYYLCNVDGTRHILEWARKSKIKKFIYMSGTGIFNMENTDMIEDNLLVPNTNHYHISKFQGEILARVYNEMNIRTVIFRISAPYGYIKNNSVIPKFLSLATSNANLELWGGGSRMQTFTFVKDIGLACKLAIENISMSGIYNISGGVSITMKELARTILYLLPESNSEIIFKDKKDPQDGKIINIPITKAQEKFNYYPQYSIQEGIKEILTQSKKFIQ